MWTFFNLWYNKTSLTRVPKWFARVTWLSLGSVAGLFQNEMNLNTAVPCFHSWSRPSPCRQWHSNELLQTCCATGQRLGTCLCCVKIHKWYQLKANYTTKNCHPVFNKLTTTRPHTVITRPEERCQTNKAQTSSGKYFDMLLRPWI